MLRCPVHPRLTTSGSTLVRHAVVAALAAVLGLLISACQKPETEVDYHAWINPISGAQVTLPEGWRHEPETAARGETTVGFFIPNFSHLLGRYGHISLHYEYLDDPARPMTLERFVGNFTTYMRYLSRMQSQPVFAVQESLKTARLTVRATHGQRQLLLQVSFWTPDGRDYWYAVVESEVDDVRFGEMAAPIVDLLRASTREQ